MLDTNALNAECIHAVKLMLEAILAAGFLTFLTIMYSCCVVSGKCARDEERRNGGPRQ